MNDAARKTNPFTLKQVAKRAWEAKNERREKIATTILTGTASQYDGLSPSSVDRAVQEAVAFAEVLMTRLDEVAEGTKP